jgi:DNA ligase-associated metallophosphoesterase
MPWTLAGESVLLDAERALAWPAAATVFVADLHLGKDQALREAGLAMPRGSAEADLERLDRVVERHAARRLVVLGDLVHSRTLATARWIGEFRDWLAARPGLAVDLVAGNHDRWLPDWPGIRCLDAGTRLGPFVVRHEPDAAPDGHVLAGHLHPGAVLRERHAPPIRLPAFWCGPRRTVLPAFGRLTGLSPGRAASDDRIVACAGAHLVPLPTPGRRSESGPRQPNVPDDPARPRARLGTGPSRQTAATEPGEPGSLADEAGDRRAGRNR